MPATKKQAPKSTTANKQSTKTNKITKKHIDKQHDLETHNKMGKKGLNVPTKVHFKKDMGLPNLGQFKKKFDAKIAKRKEQTEEKEKKTPENQNKMETDDDTEMQEEKPINPQSAMAKFAKLQLDATRKNIDFNDKEVLTHGDSAAESSSSEALKDISKSSTSTNTLRGYYKEFQKVVEQADVILEVLDARDPLGCRAFDIEKQIQSKDMNKKIVLVLNKADLVPHKMIVEKWMDHLKESFPTVAFSCSNSQLATIMKKNAQLNPNSAAGEKKPKSMKKSDKIDTILPKDKKIDPNSPKKRSLNLSQAACVKKLISLLKNYCRSQDIKKKIHVGIIGYPNVGKSSLVNALKRNKKVAAVGNRPGFTKSMQSIQLDSNIVLLDSPGIIFSKEDRHLSESLILKNSIPIDSIDDDDVVMSSQVILSKMGLQKMIEFYDLILPPRLDPSFSNLINSNPATANAQNNMNTDINTMTINQQTDLFLTLFAQKRGILKKGGKPRLSDAGRIVLKDWNDGKIPFYTVPPNEDPNSIAALVAKKTSVTESEPQDIFEEDDEEDDDDDDYDYSNDLGMSMDNKQMGQDNEEDIMEDD